jgi:DNA polymerase I-like protein with 3'-5' exonuclease and polymerase domains
MGAALYGHGKALPEAFGEYCKEMEDYCMQDVRVTAALYHFLLSKKVSPEAIILEHEFQYLMAAQELHGFRFDRQGAARLSMTLQAERLRLEARLQTVFPPDEEPMKTPEYYYSRNGSEIIKAPTKSALRTALKARFGRAHGSHDICSGPLKVRKVPFNPGSADQVADRFKRKYTWKPKRLTPTGKAQVDETVLAALPYKEAVPLLEYMKLEKILGLVHSGENAWLRLCAPSGYMHGAVKTLGTVSGRCAHARPNIAQVPSVLHDEAGGPVTGLSGGFGAECRRLFRADPGWVLVGMDASGLELRCLAHYMHQWDGGAYARVVETGDIHTENQKLAGLKTRSQAKTFIYALLYGAGDGKLGAITGRGPRDGKKLRKNFMENLPAFKKLSEAVQSTANRRGCLRGLDGRRLPVRASYAALNVLLQSAGAVIMKRFLVSLVRLLASRGVLLGRQYHLCANVHDEVQLTCPAGIADTIKAAAAAAFQEVSKNLHVTLTGSCSVGDSWCDTH